MNAQKNHQREKITSTYAHCSKAGLLLMLYSALGLMSAPTLALDQGHLAPAFELGGNATETIKLANYSGKVIYVDFWASWCGPCKHSFPWMNDIQSKYGAKGLQIIGINLDAKIEDAQRFLKTNPANFITAFDPAGITPKAYAIKGMPTSYLIGRDGKVLLQHAGFKESDKTELEKKIQEALGK